MNLELNQFRDVDVVLDKANDNFIQKQFVSSGDKDGRSLTVQITENGVIGEIIGATLNLYWHNEASGLTDLSAFSVVDRATSVFKINYPQNMLTPGKVIAYIQILHGGKVTHTKPFEITVQKLAGTTRGVLATAEYGALVTTLAKANEFETDIAEVSAQLAQNVNLACILRQDTSTGVWSILNDAGHTSSNVLSVSQDDNKIRIDYSKQFSKIKSFLIAPDDVLNKSGFIFGGDVGTSYANITIKKHAPISAHIASNASGGLTVNDNIGIKSIDYVSNEIVIEHEKPLKTLSPVLITNMSNAKFNVTPKDVGDNYVKLALNRNKKPKSALFTWNGTSFTISGDFGYSIASFTGGDIVIKTQYESFDGFYSNVTSGKIGYVVNIKSISSNSITLQVFDSNTNAQLTNATLPSGFFFTLSRENTGSTPSTLTTNDVSFFLSRESEQSGVTINPSTRMPAGNNIWVYGLFKE